MTSAAAAAVVVARGASPGTGKGTLGRGGVPLSRDLRAHETRGRSRATETPDRRPTEGTEKALPLLSLFCVVYFPSVPKLPTTL